MTGVVLLDGGMGQELVARSRHPLHPLWSAFVLLEEPEIVRAVHEEYLAAGAKVLTVNAYSVTHQRLEPAGLADRFAALQRAACEIALAARDAAGDADTRVAGCLPPLVGSYRPDLMPEDHIAAGEYRRIAEAQAPHVDVFLCETMGSAREARRAAMAAAETGKPVWVALTLRDGGDRHLRSGETVAAAAQALADIPAAALLANCCHPESVAAAVPELAATGLPWGAYANAFQSVAPLEIGGTVAGLVARPEMTPETYAETALGWVGQGASIVGGCCEVGPAHIARLAARLRAAGHAITGDLAPEPEGQSS